MEFLCDIKGYRRFGLQGYIFRDFTKQLRRVSQRYMRSPKPSEGIRDVLGSLMGICMDLNAFQGISKVLKRNFEGFSKRLQMAQCAFCFAF